MIGDYFARQVALFQSAYSGAKASLALAPSPLALVLLGLAGAGILCWQLATLVRRSGGRRNPSVYYASAALMLLVVYWMDSTSYLQEVRSGSESLIVTAVWNGDQWQFAYPNEAESLDQLMLPKGRLVQLRLSASRGTRALRLGCGGPSAIALPGRYSTVSLWTGRTVKASLCCAPECSVSTTANSRTNSTRYASELRVVDGLQFDRWLEANAKASKHPG